MKLDKLVVNASPIISLAKIGHADLLKDLVAELVVPEGVCQEIACHGRRDLAAEWIKRQDSSLLRPVDIPTIISEWNLGKGESQVMAFAYHNPGFAVAIDDRAARNCAELFSLRVYGTISLIIKAKQFGLLPAVKPVLSQLRTVGFRISEAIVDAALGVAEE